MTVLERTPCPFRAKVCQPNRDDREYIRTHRLQVKLTSRIESTGDAA